MDWISALVYSFLPEAVRHNIWFVFALVAAYGAVSETMPFLPTKYNGPAHWLLSVLGVWKTKEAAVMPMNGPAPPASQPVDPDPLKANK